MDPMNAFDLVIRNGLVATADGVRAADVAVNGQTVAALLEPDSAAEARVVVRAAGRILLPGLIDSHVHFRTPGLTDKEDWQAGSRAAVAGGVTTVIDMPDTIPATETAADAHHKHRAIAGTSLVDYRLHLGVHLDRVETLTELTPREATTVRALPGAGSAKLDKLFALAAERGLRLLFHAEDEAVSTLLDSWLGAPAQPTDYERCRPRTAGIVAVSQLIELARRYGTPAHILHVSSREEVDLLTAAGAAGIPTTFEVTGHHLSFTSADTIRQGARLRLVPAIRDEADRDRLWSALTDGQTTTIASDHAPHRLADKQLPAPDAPAGAPGVQELLSAVFTGLRRRQLLDSAAAAQVIAQTLAERPAQLFGLAGRKGRIAPGLDADIVIFDPDRPSTPHPHEVYAKCGWSAYEGWTFAGRVELTLRRGEIVYDRRTGSARFGAPSGEWLSATGAIN